MTKKVNLPVMPASAKPSIEAARARLGGAAHGAPLPPGLAPGVVVRFEGGAGVVIFASIVEVHVLLDPSRMRRFPPDELAVHDGAHGLEELAADAHIFGLLRDGQSVRYAAVTGELVDGVIVEKCRWGALVQTRDVVVAVGFRKLWPAPGGASA